MISATISTPDHRLLGTWDEVNGYDLDPLLLPLVQGTDLDPRAHYPFPELESLKAAAARLGLVCVVSGEPDPLPDGALG